MYGNKILPPYCLITGDLDSDTDTFLSTLENALHQDIKLVQLRVKCLADKPYKILAQKSLQLCRQYKATLLLNTNIELAKTIDADGIHLTSARLMACQSRPMNMDKWVCAACHDLAQLRHAVAINVDFVTLSPVLETTSHPQAKPLGWQAFAELVTQVDLPIYALGGMQMIHLSKARQCGAQGIAAISAFWHTSSDATQTTTNIAI
ncbi:MAG: thiamine phosphate synthase [Gammaproteobacteria bacterium]